MTPSTWRDPRFAELDRLIAEEKSLKSAPNPKPKSLKRAGGKPPKLELCQCGCGQMLGARVRRRHGIGRRRQSAEERKQIHRDRARAYAQTHRSERYAYHDRWLEANRERVNKYRRERYARLKESGELERREAAKDARARALQTPSLAHGLTETHRPDASRGAL